MELTQDELRQLAAIRTLKELDLEIVKKCIQPTGLSIPLWFAILFCGMIFIIGYFVGRCI